MGVTSSIASRPELQVAFPSGVPGEKQRGI